MWRLTTGLTDGEPSKFNGDMVEIVAAISSKPSSWIVSLPCNIHVDHIWPYMVHKKPSWIIIMVTDQTKLRKCNGSPTLDNSTGAELILVSTESAWHSRRLLLLSIRPVITFLATEHHHLLASTKLHCLVTEALCQQLAQSRHLTEKWS